MYVQCVHVMFMVEHKKKKKKWLAFARGEQRKRSKIKICQTFLYTKKKRREENFVAFKFQFNFVFVVTVDRKVIEAERGLFLLFWADVSWKRIKYVNGPLTFFFGVQAELGVGGVIDMAFWIDTKTKIKTFRWTSKERSWGVNHSHDFIGTCRD